MPPRGGRRAAAASAADQERLNRMIHETLDDAKTILRKDTPTSHELRSSLADLTNCIHQSPAHVQCYFERSKIYIKLNEPKLALFDLTMAIQMGEPVAKEEVLAQLYGTRGQCFRHLGKLEDSLCDFKRAKVYDGHLQWFYEMGVSFYDLGDKWRALEMFSMALGEQSAVAALQASVARQQAETKAALAAAAAASASQQQQGGAGDGAVNDDASQAGGGAAAGPPSSPTSPQQPAMMTTTASSAGAGGAARSGFSSGFGARHGGGGDGGGGGGRGLRREQKVKCLVYRGNTFRELGALAESVEDLKRAVDMEPESAPTNNILGLCYFEQGDYRNAVTAFDKAVQLDGNDAMYHNNLGLAHFQLSKFTEALDAFQAAVRLDKGKTANILFNKGNAELAMGLCTSAIQNFDRAIDIDPDDENTYHAKGIAYQNMDNPDIEAAIEQFQEALKLNPTFKPSLFHMGLMYHTAGKPFKAMDCFAQVARADPTDRRAFENLGLVYCDQLYFDLAVGAFTRAIELLPSNAVNYFYRGKSLLWLGRYDSATLDFNRAVELRCEEPQVYSCRALSLKYQKRYGEAIADLTKALSLSSEGEFWYHRAMCYAETGQYEKAVDDLREALKIDNGQSRMHFLKGKCNYLMGKYEEALRDLGTARATDPNASHSCECFYYMGLSHARLNEYAHALHHFSEACARKPNCPQYVHERAKALQVEGRFEEAVQDFTKVLALQPLNAHALFRRAFAWKSVRKFDEASEDFENARKLQPLNVHLVVNFKQVYQVDYVVLCPPGDEPPYEEMVSIAEAAREAAHVR